MLEDFLTDIYSNALTLEYLKETSFYSACGHFQRRRENWNNALKLLEKIITDLRSIDATNSDLIMKYVKKAQDCFGDQHCFSALIDLEIIPRVAEYLKNFTGINVSDGEWTIESSMTGFLTVKDNHGGYVHSFADPMWEAFLYANNIYDPRVSRYHILGGGLGYLAYQLWRISEGEVEIYVYEPDPVLGAYSDLYGVRSFINSNKVHYITGDDADDIMMQFSEDISGVSIVRTVAYWDDSKYEGSYSDIVRTRLSNEETFRAFELKWRSNYSANLTLEHKKFKDFSTEKSNDEWLIVGSGPSLTDNETFIIDSIGKRTICVVNSSFKWFCLHNIKPDLCVACDPSDDMEKHIKGLEGESENVPLIADCVTNHKFVKAFCGPKYYIFSQSSEFIAKESGMNEDIWTFGGTVTSMALETALRMGAKKIYLIGADLGYPNGDTFAEGVAHDKEKRDSGEGTVVSVDEKIIPTTFIFLDYKNAIEKQIADNPGVEVINKSQHGAYITGTFCNKWWENLPDTNVFADYENFLIKLKEITPLLGWSEKYYIFGQILGRIENSGMILGEDENRIIQEVYGYIYDELRKELNYACSPDGKVVGKLTYIMTDEYTGEKDIITRRVIERAKAETKNKQNVIIVNTGEKFGGKNVAIHGRCKQRYRTDLELSDKIYYENSVFPYFQLPEGMPDIRHYRAFLESMSQNVPGKLIKISKYSLLADLCSDLLNIDVELSDKNF